MWVLFATSPETRRCEGCKRGALASLIDVSKVLSHESVSAALVRSGNLSSRQHWGQVLNIPGSILLVCVLSLAGEEERVCVT